MSKKDRKHQRHEHEEHRENEQQEHEHPTETSKDLLEYDTEKARELINLEDSDRKQGDLSHPNPDDPQRKKGSITPGQENVPAGQTTGSGMQGGSANRRKR
jgi:hypothetical protein